MFSLCRILHEIIIFSSFLFTWSCIVANENTSNFFPWILHAPYYYSVNKSTQMIDPTIRQKKMCLCCIEFQHFARQHIWWHDAKFDSFGFFPLFLSANTKHHYMKMRNNSNDSDDAINEFTYLIDYLNEFDSRHLQAVEFPLFHGKMGCHCDLLLWAPFYVQTCPIECPRNHF